MVYNAIIVLSYFFKQTRFALDILRKKFHLLSIAQSCDFLRQMPRRKSHIVQNRLLLSRNST